jgi:hypothetical protein
MQRAALAIGALVALGGCLGAADGEDPAFRSDTYLRDLHWKSGPGNVVLRIHAQSGYEPLAKSTQVFADVLAEAVQKPVTVEVSGLDVDAGRATNWTSSELFDLGRAANAEPWRDGTVVIHVLALPGSHWTRDLDGWREVAGVAIFHAAYVFPDTWRTVTLERQLLPEAPLVGAYEFERYVYMHEVGHVLGLVDNGVAAQERSRITDDACRCHSTDRDSVMFGYNPGPSLATEPGHDVGEIQRILADERSNFRYNANDLQDLRAFQALG